jgi:hypothetical protein
LLIINEKPGITDMPKNLSGRKEEKFMAIKFLSVLS